MPAGKSRCQVNSPFSTLRSHASGMRNPKVMASITGGHFFMVKRSSRRVSLKAFCGNALNQSGRPRTAGGGGGGKAWRTRGERGGGTPGGGGRIPGLFLWGVTNLCEIFLVFHRFLCVIHRGVRIIQSST